MSISSKLPPAISIVTPCYNSKRFIGRLHRSLCSQTFRDFEWVLVDDCSTDETVEMLRELPDPGKGGTLLFKLPKNSGGGIALGLGVEKSSGAILIMIDHDDELLPDALSVVVREWIHVKNRPDLAGIFFRRLEPTTNTVVGGELRQGTIFSMSWQINMKPHISDGFLTLKTEIAKRYFNPKSLEAICLSGVPLGLMTKRYKLIAGPSDPLLIYHRDNPSSQTNSVKVSRKTVFTYARYIDDYDIYYFRRPVRWIRHIIALIKFSIAVHGHPTYHHKYVHSRLILFLSFTLVPLGILRYFTSRKDQIVNLPYFDVDALNSIKNIRL